MSGEKKRPFRLREDFPIKRMLFKLALGNAAFIGIYHLLWALPQLWSGLEYYMERGVFIDPCRYTINFIRRFLFDPLYLGALLLAGTFLSILWYIIARQIETRRLRKKWLIIQQRSRVETPPL